MWYKQLIAFLFGSGDAKGPVTTFIERYVPDKNARAEAKEALERELVQWAEKSDLAQLDVNKAEAAHSSVFVAGWRPFIGWVGGFSLAWQFAISPILAWFLTVAQGIWQFTVPPLPALDTSQLWTIVTGMLGLGGLRTYEKKYGVDRSTMKEP